MLITVSAKDPSLSLELLGKTTCYEFHL